MSTLARSSALTPIGAVASPLLRIRNVAKSFGRSVVLRDISLQVAEGEFLTILGESGSGKTTLLRIIAGFENATSGEVWMADERLDSLPPYKRRVNTVFQNYALFPHLTVEQNVAYGLRVARQPETEVASRVEQALARVKMTAYAKAKPSKISGGQQQRVALARALVNRPQLLLLDEPLSALDANLRRQMQVELKSLQREVGISFVFVTHDQEEAMVMSDRIALLRTGELEQVATPREIYRRPATAYTAQFIGHTNLLRGEVRGGIARCSSLSWRAQLPDGPALFSLGRRTSGSSHQQRPPPTARCACEATCGTRPSMAQPSFCKSNARTGRFFRADCQSRREAKRIGTRFSSRGRGCGSRISRTELAHVLARLQSGRHRSSTDVGDRVPARPLSPDVLLQLLVGVRLAEHRALLDARELSAARHHRRRTGRLCCVPCGLPPASCCSRCCSATRSPTSCPFMPAPGRNCSINW